SDEVPPTFVHRMVTGAGGLASGSPTQREGEAAPALAPVHGAAVGAVRVRPRRAPALARAALAAPALAVLGAPGGRPVEYERALGHGADLPAMAARMRGRVSLEGAAATPTQAAAARRTMHRPRAAGRSSPSPRLQ